MFEVICGVWMKVVFIKKNDFFNYNISLLNGYKFNPRNKNISLLSVIDKDFIEYILSKKIKREINKIKRVIKMFIKSDITIISDCDMMNEEIIKVIKKLDKKYRKYFNEFDYFDYIKELYFLHNLINYKKKILDI